MTLKQLLGQPLGQHSNTSNLNVGQFVTTWDTLGQNFGHVTNDRGQLCDNLGQLRTTTPRNNHVELENNVGQKNSALGEGTYISHIVTACIGGVVSGAVCRARFVT